MKLSQLGRLRCALLGATLALGALVSSAAFAQDIITGQGGGLIERVLQLIALLTVLSLAPSILVMVTSFTRIVVVLSLLVPRWHRDRAAQCGADSLAMSSPPS